MIHWAALIVASLSWIFAYHQFVTEDHSRQWLLIGIAAWLGTLAFRRRAGQVHLRLRYGVLLIPLVAALIFAGPAYRPALLLVGAGVILLVTASNIQAFTVVKPAGLAALVLGAILVFQSGSYWLYSAWTARNPDVPYVASIIYALLKWVGFDASLSHETVFVRMMRHVHVIPPTWNHLALYPMLQIWLAGGLMIWQDRAARPFLQRLTALSAVLLAYAVFRLFLMILVFVTAMVFVRYGEDTVHVEVFWLPWITGLSLLPLIPILARLVPWPAGGPQVVGEEARWDCPRQRGAAIALACAGCVGLVIGVHFWDPGTPKAGRLLLDESHSRWERTDNVYDTDWYGHESGYNYYCMAQYLGHYYDIDFNMDEPLTPAKLAAYDVLILKTPTEPYEPEEIEAIDDFVRQGGGLFALGEHTNVFGSSACLNPVARRYGIAFRYDVVLDIVRRWIQNVYPPVDLVAHPIIQRMPLFRFAVSASIETNSWNVRPVIRSSGLWTLPIDYASGNFYPHVEDTTYARFGTFDQMVSTTAGRGRVVAFADSTVYSNFLAFYPGKPETLLGAVDWLNRSNRWNWINTLGYAVFAGALAALVLIWRRLRPHPVFLPAVAVNAAAATWLTMWACAAHAREAYPAPQPRRPIHNVVFEMDHSSYELPVFAFTQDYTNSYAVFYQWVLRLGYFESISFDFDQSLQSSDPIVLIKPTRPFTAQTLSRVRAYLERGGAVLLMDVPTNTESTSNQLLEPFGMSLVAGQCHGRSVVEPESGARICGIRCGQTVEGGTPLLTTDVGEPVAAYTTVGRGLLVVAGLADRFNDPQMGGSTRTVPNREMRAVYELEFALLRGLVQGDLPQEVRSLGDIYAPTSP